MTENVSDSPSAERSAGRPTPLVTDLLRQVGRPSTASALHRSPRPLGQLLATILTATVIPLAASRGERLEFGTDRDAFTPCAHAVDPGTALVETSYVYIDNQSGLPTNNYPEFLLRLGLSERFELRVGANYGVGSQGNVVTAVEAGEGQAEGGALYEQSMLYGFKLDVSRQQGLIPESSFMMEGSTPTYGHDFGTIPVATYIAGWELDARLPTRGAAAWRLDGAMRWSYVEGRRGWFNRWSPSAVLRMPTTERLELHIEYFASFTQGQTDDFSQPFVSPGCHYVLTEHIEIGYRCGWGLTNEAAVFFSDAGLAVRW